MSYIEIVHLAIACAISFSAGFIFGVWMVRPIIDDTDDTGDTDD